MAPYWRHYGVMDLTPYVEQLRRDLAVAVESAGPDAAALADRLAAHIEPSTRLVLLGALSAAAADITRELAPGSVDVRLRGIDPEFVVAPAPERTADAVPQLALPGDPAAPGAPPGAAGDDDATARINLRLPESLKAKVEEAAARDGLSVNSWLVRTLATALRTDLHDGTRRQPPALGQRLTGWVQ